MSGSIFGVDPLARYWSNLPYGFRRFLLGRATDEEMESFILLHCGRPGGPSKVHATLVRRFNSWKRRREQRRIDRIWDLWELTQQIDDSADCLHYFLTKRKDPAPAPKKRKNYRFRHWVYTLNNPTREETAMVNSLIEGDTSLRYLVYQLEEGDEGTPHHQGYCEFTDRMSMAKLKKMPYFERAHLESRKGNRDQARVYCKKEEGRIEGPFEFGEWIKNTGQKHIINEMIESAQNGIPLSEALDAPFRTVLPRYFKFYQTVQSWKYKERARTLYLNRETVDRKVLCLIGPTGSGKTSYVYKNHEIQDIYKWTGGSGSKGSVFFDDYEGEKVILLDDFGKGQLPYRLMLILCDIYPVRFDIKGSHTYIPWETIYISSNQMPEHWYPKRSHVDELLRRITKTVSF